MKGVLKYNKQTSNWILRYRDIIYNRQAVLRFQKIKKKKKRKEKPTWNE